VPQVTELSVRGVIVVCAKGATVSAGSVPCQRARIETEWYLCLVDEAEVTLGTWSCCLVIWHHSRAVIDQGKLTLQGVGVFLSPSFEANVVTPYRSQRGPDVGWKVCGNDLGYHSRRSP
jgi:hypothetical protein